MKRAPPCPLSHSPTLSRSHSLTLPLSHALTLPLLFLLAGCAAPPPPAPPAPRSTRCSTIPAGVEAERITFSADGLGVAWLSKSPKGDRVVLNGRDGPSFGFV